MRTKINFDFKDYNITAQAIVLNSSLVTRMELFYHDIDESDRPSSSELIEEIEEYAQELLLEEANCPEVMF